MARVIIVGGGLSGLSLAYYLLRDKPSYEVVLIEKSPYLGGKARTLREQGFIVECGVNGVLDNKPSTIALATALDVAVYPSDRGAKRRFIVRSNGQLKIPESPIEFLKSDLLSFKGKLRLLKEPFIPSYFENPNRDKGSYDETVEEFVKRRIGDEALSYLIDPMVTGIFAGDPKRLSLRHCFPKIYNLEAKYGGLIRGMLQLKRKAKRGTNDPKGVSAGPAGMLVSFKKGIGELVDALYNWLIERMGDDAIIKGIGAKEIIWHDRFKVEVSLQDGSSISGSHAVIACPSKDAAMLFRGSGAQLKALSSLLSSIDYPPIAVVAFGVKKGAVRHDLDGFGFLCPNIEARKILGTLWDSSIFPNRAPEGMALLRSLVGGARQRTLPLLPDKDLIDLVYKELKGLMGMVSPPDFVKIYRWPRAIPQYNRGYGQILEGVQGILCKKKGIIARCNWIGGVSLNDCIYNSRLIARTI